MALEHSSVDAWHGSFFWDLDMPMEPFSLLWWISQLLKHLFALYQSFGLFNSAAVHAVLNVESGFVLSWFCMLLYCYIVRYCASQTRLVEIMGLSLTDYAVTKLCTWFHTYTCIYLVLHMVVFIDQFSEILDMLIELVSWFWFMSQVPQQMFTLQ